MSTPAGTPAGLPRPEFDRIVAAMLRLLLLRHAKSSWENLALDDFDRPLNKRGTKAASLIGRHLVTHDLVPDLVLCSTAVRTRATLTLVMNEIAAAPPRVIHDEALYLADAETLIARIWSVEPRYKTVMVVAHNPGLHAAALQLTGSGDTALLELLAMQFPTAALACIRFDIDNWRRIAPATGTLTDFVLPRQLG